jgi:hypothetical protein
MRLLLITVVAFAAIVCIEKSAAAQNGGWCAYYNYAFGPKELRACNIATVLGRCARGGWRELLTQSILPAAVLPEVSTELSVLIGL